VINGDPTSTINVSKVSMWQRCQQQWFPLALDPARYDRSKFQFHVAVLLATPKTQAFTVQVTEQDNLRALRTMQITRRQIRAAVASGDFVPNREHQMCSRRWCGYWAQCENEHGGKVAP
jgi:hypothetical protein